MSNHEEFSFSLDQQEALLHLSDGLYAFKKAIVAAGLELVLLENFYNETIDMNNQQMLEETYTFFETHREILEEVSGLEHALLTISDSGLD